MEWIGEIIKFVLPAVVTGYFVWRLGAKKNKNEGDATIADAALKWSIEDRAEMVKLREELSKTKAALTETRDALDAAKLDIIAKTEQLDKYCEKIEELEKRIEKIMLHGDR